MADFFWTLYSGIGFIDTSEKNYNLGNREYQQESFEEAKSSYLDTLTVDTHNTQALYNLANSQYRLGNLEEAIELYEEVIKIEQDLQAIKNLEFVRSKLLIQDSQEQQSSQEEEENSDGQENAESSEQENGESEETKGEDNSGEQSSEQEGLSEETKQILEQRAQDLQESQDALQKYYNKNHTPNNSQSLFDRIFDNSLLQQTGEKDW